MSGRIRGRGRDLEAGSPLSAEPGVGLDPTTPSSRPERKPRAGRPSGGAAPRPMPAGVTCSSPALPHPCSGTGAAAERAARSSPQRRGGLVASKFATFNASKILTFFADFNFSFSVSVHGQWLEACGAHLSLCLPWGDARALRVQPRARPAAGSACPSLPPSLGSCPMRVLNPCSFVLICVRVTY